MKGDTLELVAPDPDIEHKREPRSVGNHYRVHDMKRWKGPFVVLVPSQGSQKRRSHWDAVETLDQEPPEGFPRYLSRVHGQGTYWVQGQVGKESVRIRLQVTPRMAENFGVQIEPPRRSNPVESPGVELVLSHLRDQNAELRAELAELRAALMSRGDEGGADELDEDDIADRVAERLAERQPNPVSLWTPETVTKMAAALAPLVRQMNPPPPPPSPWAPIIALFERSGQTPATVLDAIERGAQAEATADESEG